MNYSGEIIDY